MGHFPKDKDINLLHTEAERMYRRLVEELRIGVFMADTYGKLFYVNNTFVNIFGYASREAVLGSTLAENLCLDPQARNRFLHTMEKTGFVKDYIIENEQRNGSVTYLSVTSNYIRNSNEEIIGLEGVVEDITAHYKLEREAEMLRTTVEQAADHVMITDTAGKILYVNQAFEETTGYAREEILYKNPKVLQSGKHGKDYYERLWSTILAGNVFCSQTTNKSKHGQLYIADQSITPIKDEAGHITHFVSVWKDVTEKVHLQEQLRREKAKLLEIINLDKSISTMSNTAACQTVVNQIAAVLDAERVMYLAVDSSGNRLVLKAQAGYPINYKQGLSIPLSDKFAGNVALSEMAMHVENARDHLHLTNSAIPDYLGTSFIIAPVVADGDMLGVMVVTGRKEEGSLAVEFDHVDLNLLVLMCKEAAVGLKNAESYNALAELTVTDPMTHIHNFRYFQKTLHGEMKRAKRFKRPLCIMMIDVDRFKAYNDSLGHQEGDELLKAISRVLTANLREIDAVCRYGGDEFVVVLPELDLPDAVNVANRMRHTVGQLELKMTVTLSIGIARREEHMDEKGFIQAADKALYKAKQNGRNQVCSIG